MDPIDRRQSAVLSCSRAVRPPDWPCGGLPAGLLGCLHSELAGTAASDVLFGVSISFRCLFTRPVASEFALCSLFFFFPPSCPCSYEVFLPPCFCSVFPKSQRDSRWGVVGYDLRAGCDVRRGSQRCVGRGARGAVPGMDWAWSWACRTDTGSGCGWAVLVGQTDGRTGGRADMSLRCLREGYRCCGWEGRIVANSTSSVWERRRRRLRQRRSRKQPTEAGGGGD